MNVQIIKKTETKSTIASDWESFNYFELFRRSHFDLEIFMRLACGAIKFIDSRGQACHFIYEEKELDGGNFSECVPVYDTKIVLTSEETKSC